MIRVAQQAGLAAKAKATPQVIAVALAMACLILPANPVLPIPTVGGDAHASGDCSGLRELVGRLQAELDAANTGGLARTTTTSGALPRTYDQRSRA